MPLKTDYKAGDEVTVVSIPAHIERLNLIGKVGTVHLNDPSERETPLQVYIDGRDWNHLYHFEYENVEPVND
jgi:hypothetical protein